MFRAVRFATVLGALLFAPAMSRASLGAQRVPEGMVRIPAGTYRALYGTSTTPPKRVDTFLLDRDPVTRREFNAFVQTHQEWSRSRVNPTFADRTGYLTEWRSDSDAGSALDLQRPVTSVSWFAARAYCSAVGKRLPTVAQWEYVAAADSSHRDASRDMHFIQHVMQEYTTRSMPIAITTALERNVYGVRALHSSAWEWVEDFNSVLVSDDSRGVGGRDHDLYCASAAIGAVDPSNYPAFLRYAVRAGLRGSSTMQSLGFRCAL